MLRLFAHSCPTLCDPVDCSPPGSSVRGILQARRLEWVVRPSSRGSSQARGQTQVSPTVGGFFTLWSTRGVAQRDWDAQINEAVLRSPLWCQHQWSLLSVPVCNNVCITKSMRFKVNLPGYLIYFDCRHSWLYPTCPMGQETATHSSLFAWKISRTEEPAGLPSQGLQRVGHNSATEEQTCTNIQNIGTFCQLWKKSGSLLIMKWKNVPGWKHWDSWRMYYSGVNRCDAGGVGSVSDSCTSDCVTPRTVAHQAPLSMWFSRQESWSGLPFPSPGVLSSPGIKPQSLALWTHSSPSEPPSLLLR